MEVIKINNCVYELIRNKKNAFNLDETISFCTEYFDTFDYIFGDYSYGRLRLKGFFDSNNKKVKELNDIKFLDNYIANYCSYDCKYFLLKKTTPFCENS